MAERAVRLADEIDRIDLPLPSDAVKRFAGSFRAETTGTHRRVKSDKKQPGWRTRARSAARQKQARSNTEQKDAGKSVKTARTNVEKPMLDVQNSLRPQAVAPGAPLLAPSATSTDVCWQSCLRGHANAVSASDARSNGTRASRNTSKDKHRDTSKQMQPSGRSSTTSRRRSTSRADAPISYRSSSETRPFGLRIPAHDGAVTPERNVIGTPRRASALGEHGSNGAGPALGSVAAGVSSHWVPSGGGAILVGSSTSRALEPGYRVSSSTSTETRAGQLEGPVVDATETEFVVSSPAGRQGLVRRRAAELASRLDQDRDTRRARHHGATSTASRGLAATTTKGDVRRGQRRQRSDGGNGNKSSWAGRRAIRMKMKKKKKAGTRKSKQPVSVSSWLRRRQAAEAGALRRAASGAALHGSAHAPLLEAQQKSAQSGLAETVSRSTTQLMRLDLDLYDDAPNLLGGSIHHRRRRAADASGRNASPKVTIDRNNAVAGGLDQMPMMTTGDGGYTGVLGRALERERLRRREQVLRDDPIMSDRSYDADNAGQDVSLARPCNDLTITERVVARSVASERASSIVAAIMSGQRVGGGSGIPGGMQVTQRFAETWGQVLGGRIPQAIMSLTKTNPSPPRSRDIVHEQLSQGQGSGWLRREGGRPGLSVSHSSLGAGWEQLIRDGALTRH